MTDSVTVWLNKDPERTLTIPIWKTYDGGVSFTDFTFPSEVTFTSGEIFKKLTFTTTQDQQDENGERVGFEIREAAPRGDSGLSPPEHGVHCRRRRGGQRLHQRHQRSAGRERDVHAGAGDAAHRRRHRHPVVQGGTGDVLSAHNHLCAQRLEQAKDGYGGVGAVHGVAFHAGVGVRARLGLRTRCDAHPHCAGASHRHRYDAPTPRLPSRRRRASHDATPLPTAAVTPTPAPAATTTGEAPPPDDGAGVPLRIWPLLALLAVGVAAGGYVYYVRTRRGR